MNFPTIVVTKPQPAKTTMASAREGEKYVSLKAVIKQVRTETSTEHIARATGPVIKLHR